MKTHLPSADEVAASLRLMRIGDLRRLADLSGVPYRTLLKIRLGETSNPGLETVRKFFHLLPVPTDTQATAQPTAQEA